MALGHRTQFSNPDNDGSNQVLYFDNFFSGTGCVYSIRGEAEEIFWDVSVSNKFFAVVGTSMQPTSDVFMHRIPTGTSVGGFMAAFGYRFRYQDLSPYKPDNIGGIRSVALGNDSLAFASYYVKNFNVGVYERGLQMSTVSINTGQMDYYQRYTLLSNTTSWPTMMPKDMTYIPQSGNVMVIDGVLLNTSDVVLQLKPYLNSYSSYYAAPFFLNSNVCIPVSLSLYSTNYCLVAYDYYSTISNEWVLLDMGLMVPPYYGSNTYCYTTYMADMIIYPSYTVSNNHVGTVVIYNMSIGRSSSPVSPSVYQYSCEGNESK